MGLAESIANESLKSTNMKAAYFFSTANIEKMRNEIKNNDPLSDFGKRVEVPISLSSIIENILSYQRNTGEICQPKSLVDSFTKPVLKDTDANIERVRTYSKYLQHMISCISRIIDDEETSLTTKNLEISKKFVSLNKSRKTQTSFLETILSQGFESLFSDLDILEPNDVIHFLITGIELMKSNSEHSLNEVSSPVIHSLHHFATSLASFPKFRTLDIQWRVVYFLYQLGISQKNVCGCVSALIYLFSLYPDNDSVEGLSGIDLNRLDSILEDNEYGLGDGDVKFSKLEMMLSKPGSFLSLKQKIVHQLTGHLDKILEGILNEKMTRSSQAFSFFVDSTEEAINLATDLIRLVLSDNKCFEDLKIGLLSVGLKLISANLFRYVLSFARTERTINENDLSIFQNIRGILKECIFSPLAVSSCCIMESIVSIFAHSFRYLYFSCCSTFHKLIIDIVNNPVLSNQFLNVIFMLKRKQALLYIFSDELSTKIESIYSTDKVIDLYLSALECLSSELQFLENNSLVSNEVYIYPLITACMKYCQNLFVSSNPNQAIILLESIVFRLVTLESFPFIASTFITNISPLMKWITDMIVSNPLSLKADAEFLKINLPEFRVTKKTAFIETPHNYPDDYFKEWKIDFKGASFIHFQFDSKCHTESMNDALRIYDSLENGNCIHMLSGPSSNWPSSLDVPFNQIRAVFSSDSSVNYWGVKADVSGLIPRPVHPMANDLSLFLHNLLYFVIGKLLHVTMQSIPLSELETNHSVFLESDFIQFVASYTKDSNFESNIIPYSPNSSTLSETEKFLSDLIHNNEDSLADMLANKLYSVVKSQFRIKNTPDNLYVEKLTFATLLHHSNMVSTAFEFAKLIKENQTEHIPPVLVSLWKIVYKIRGSLQRSSQMTSKQDGKSDSLLSNYPLYIAEIKKKNFILLQLSQFHKPSFDSPLEVYEKVFEAIRAFVCSDILWDDFVSLINIKRTRFSLMKSSLCFFKEMITHNNPLPSSELFFLLPIQDSLNLYLDISSVKTVMSSEPDDLMIAFSQLHKEIINRIINSTSILHKMLFFHIVSIPSNKLISSKDIRPFIDSFLDFVLKSSPKLLEEYIINQCAWRLICLWLIQNPNEETSHKLEEIASNESNETHQNSALLLLSVLIQYKLIKPPSERLFFSIISKSSPQSKIAAFFCLEQLYANYGINPSIPVVINDISYSFPAFVEVLIKEIGGSLCGSSNSVLCGTLLPQSYKLLCSEMISFVRFCIKPFSKVKNEIVSIIHNLFTTFFEINNFSSVTSDQAYLITGIFALLGHECSTFIPGGYGLYTGENSDGQIVRIQTFDPVTSSLVVTPVFDLDFIIANYNPTNIIPCSRIPSNPLDYLMFEKEVSFCSQIHMFSISNYNHLHDFPLFEFIRINFYSFLSIIIQAPENMALFIKIFPISSLFESAQVFSLSNNHRPVSILMNNIGQLTNKLDLLKVCGINESKSSILPYSLVYDHLSSQVFIPLRFGSVNGSTAKSSMNDCIFIGDCAIPPTVLFYFEITIKTMNNYNFKMGIMEDQSIDSDINVYGFDFKQGLPISKFFNERVPKENIKISSGDVIGCGYTKESVLFFINGIPLKTSIPVKSIGLFVPIIITSRCSMSFEFNFGQKPFFADIVSSPQFDIKSDSLHRLDIPISLSVADTQSSFDEHSSLTLIDSGISNLEHSEPYYSDRCSYYEIPSLSSSIAMEPGFEYYLHDSTKEIRKLLIGQPVYIARNSLNQVQCLSHSFTFVQPEVFHRLNRYGVIVDIVQDRNAQEVEMLTLEIIEPESNLKKRIKVDSRFVDSIPCNYLQVIDTVSLTYLTSDSSSSETRRENYIKQAKIFREDSNSLTQSLIRASSLVFLDYYRSSNSIEKLDPCLISEILSICIIEVSKFSPSIRVNESWQLTKPSDFFFCDIIETSVMEVVYKPSGDLRRINRFIRALIMSSAIQKSQIIIQILELALNRLRNSSLNTCNEIFDIIPASFRFETWHPMPITSIDLSVITPNDSIGFIPIIHPNQSIGESSIRIGRTEFIDTTSDAVLIQNSPCKLEFNGRDSRDLFGLKFGLFMVPKRFPLLYYKSPLGSIHLFIYILSLIFSMKGFHDSLSYFIKQKLFISITSLIGCGNPFIEVFSSNIIAPILTTLEWCSYDITSQIQRSFNGFSSKYEFSISEWLPLSVHAQQSLIMTIFTKLLVFDTEARSIENNSDIERISSLYDKYIEAKSLTKETTVFQQMAHAFSVLCALGFGVTIPIKFPAFLIAEAWAESFEITTYVRVPASGSHHEFPFMKDADIELDEDSNLPPDCVVEITPCEGEKVFLGIGESTVCKNIFDSRVVSRAGHEPIENKNEWWYRLYIICTPQTHEAKRKVFVDNYSLFKQHVAFMSKNWMMKYDETLRRVLKQIPSLMNMVPLKIPDTIFASNSCFASIPTQVLRCRIHLFEQLDSCIQDIVKVVDFGNTETLLGKIFNACRAAVATKFKLKTLESVVLQGINDPPPFLHLRFNRFKAALYRARPTNPNGESILSQFVNQTPIEKIPSLKRESVPWRVDLVGEGATDLGGPGRDLFTEACMEIMDPSLGLFIPTPNKSAGNGTNQELLIPNPSPMNAFKKKLYLYAGVLMTICYTSKLPEPFKFARFVWNALTLRPVTIEDIYEIDYLFKKFILSLEQCAFTNNQEFQQNFPMYFTVQNTLGNSIELIPGGSSIPVTIERRIEYINRCKQYRIKEFNEQLESLSRGFQIFFPPSASAILAPWELELLICGDNTCPVSEMKKNFNIPASDYSTDMFWEAIESFTPEERMLLIKFGCGRMGLPPPGTQWSTKLQIHFKSSALPDPRKPLPNAMTCNSVIFIPRYTSVQWMIKKIKAAITFGADIEQDHAANFGDIGIYT